jgi:hypothetical protein
MLTRPSSVAVPIFMSPERDIVLALGFERMECMLRPGFFSLIFLRASMMLASKEL